MFCRITQMGLLRLLTTERVMREDVVTQERAWQLYGEIRRDFRVGFLPEPAGIEDVWRGLTGLRQPAAAQWTDAVDSDRPYGAILMMRISTLALFGLLTAPTYAQSSFGAILGRVTDPTGAAVAGVAVKAVSAETNVAVTAASNTAGHYEISYLVPGVYQVSAEHAGFKRFVLALRFQAQFPQRLQPRDVRRAQPDLHQHRVRDRDERGEPAAHHPLGSAHRVLIAPWGRMVYDGESPGKL